MQTSECDFHALCAWLAIVDKDEARALPIKLLKCLTRGLDRIELSIHVKDCLPIVCEAAQTFLHSLEIFGNQGNDCDWAAIENNRTNLIEILTVLADEIRLCRPTGAAVPQSASNHKSDRRTLSSSGRRAKQVEE